MTARQLAPAAIDLIRERIAALDAQEVDPWYEPAAIERRWVGEVDGCQIWWIWRPAVIHLRHVQPSEAALVADRFMAVYNSYEQAVLWSGRGVPDEPVIGSVHVLVQP